MSIRAQFLPWHLLPLIVLLGLFAPARAQDAGGGSLFSISVDGQRVAGTHAPQDMGSGLAAADVQVSFDGLGTRPVLSAATRERRRTYGEGEGISFRATSNYPGYIARQEIRIFAVGRLAPAMPVAILPVKDGSAFWTMPAAKETSGFGEFVFVLRVYDALGRFDETRPLPLRRALAAIPAGTEPETPDGEDNTALRNIPADGGAVTVRGTGLPPDVQVRVMGEEVQASGGAFTVQRILPPGANRVDVTLRGKSGSVSFDREVNIPSSQWFYVGLADVTVGQRFGSGGIEAVKPGDYDSVYVKGRTAFYLKGRVKGSTLLTAAADTGEGDIADIFKGFDGKDPKSLLDRIDPDDYYPVYGDDSAAVEDAPTRGKFYVRLERGDSRVLWGNFKTDIRGTEFLRNDRSLYGGSAAVKAGRTVAAGERASEAQAYAAQPGTLPQRDVLRGTGGSAYFLSRRDITVGSESAYVEVRNAVTGRVIERRELRYGRDYTIDYLQGVVLLSRPLASTADAGTLVRDGGSGGNSQYLVVAYEYTPAAGEADGYVYGGRAQQWLGDHLRVGVTGAVEKTGEADQKLAGADVQLYKSERTFLEGEVAVSDGPGFGLSESIDGGLTIHDTDPAGGGRRAMAYRLQSSLDPGELWPGLKGGVQFSYAYKEKGFSTLDEEVTENREEIGARGEVGLMDWLSIDIHGDQLAEGGSITERKAGAGFTADLTRSLSFSAGAEQTIAHDTPRGDDGERTDVAAKLAHGFGDGNEAYIFAQGTVDRSGDISRNDRAGVGGTAQLTDTVDSSAEVSYGTGGVGAKAQLAYQPTAGDRYYIGYAMDPSRNRDTDLLSPLDRDELGGIVAGVRRGFSERLTAYAEDKYDFLGPQRSLSQVYGASYVPGGGWKLGAAVESGIVWDDNSYSSTVTSSGDIHRTALSATAAYSPDARLAASFKGEVRFDDADTHASDVTAYYLAGRFSTAVNEDWRFIATADAVIADATESTRDGDYIEATAGYAYRPVANDRFNALVKYTFLYDVPGADQVNASGSRDGPSQLSHIFSADASYDLTRFLTLGAKYGMRFGETKPRDGSTGWEEATAQLGIVRADFHVVRNWDLLLEGRALWEDTGETADYGLLAAIYRQLGDNLEIGVGYNFGYFSDDLRDITADEHGVFINLVGKL